MTKIVYELNSRTILEIEEKLINPGCPAIGTNGPWEYSSPSEGPEFDYFKAWIVRGNKRRQVSGKRLVEALERRDSDWRENTER
jgi:hypothetical protein